MVLVNFLVIHKHMNRYSQYIKQWHGWLFHKNSILCFLLHNTSLHVMISYLPTLCDQPNLIAELVSSGISSMCTCSDDSSIIVRCEHTYCSSPHSTTLQHEHLQTYPNHSQLLLLNLHAVRVKSKVYRLQHIVNCLNI